jgi:hypothetical protein
MILIPLKAREVVDMFWCSLSKKDVFVCPMGLRNCNEKGPEDESECGCYVVERRDPPDYSVYDFSSCNSETGCLHCKGERSCENVFSEKIGL